jgi:hypothetical protein
MRTRAGINSSAAGRIHIGNHGQENPMKDGLRVRMPPHYTEHQAGHKDHREMHRLAAAVLAVLLLLIPVVST